MDEDKNCIDDLKESYEPLRKKYDLPDYKFLNENFEIELISDESDLLLKRVRKQILEKIFWNLRTIETFLNPQNAPLFIFNIIKKFTEEDKEVINNLYKKLSEYEVTAFGLEIEYNEQAEADFIKNIGKIWGEIVEDLKKIHVAMVQSSNKKSEKENKSYFG